MLFSVFKLGDPRPTLDKLAVQGGGHLYSHGEALGRHLACPSLAVAGQAVHKQAESPAHFMVTETLLVGSLEGRPAVFDMVASSAARPSDIR